VSVTVEERWWGGVVDILFCKSIISRNAHGRANFPGATHTHTHARTLINSFIMYILYSHALIYDVTYMYNIVCRFGHTKTIVSIVGDYHVVSANAVIIQYNDTILYSGQYTYILYIIKYYYCNLYTLRSRRSGIQSVEIESHEDYAREINNEITLHRADIRRSPHYLFIIFRKRVYWM